MLSHTVQDTLQRCKLLLSLNNENIFTMLQIKIEKYIGKIYFCLKLRIIAMAITILIGSIQATITTNIKY